MATEDLKFKFEHKGKTYTIPRFQDQSAGTLRKARKAKNDTDMAFTILEATVGEGPELDALDDMSLEEFGAFVKEWTGGVTPGE